MYTQLLILFLIYFDYLESRKYVLERVEKMTICWQKFSLHDCDSEHFQMNPVIIQNENNFLIGIDHSRELKREDLKLVTKSKSLLKEGSSKLSSEEIIRTPLCFILASSNHHRLTLPSIEPQMMFGFVNKDQLLFPPFGGEKERENTIAYSYLRFRRWGLLMSTFLGRTS